VAHNKLGAGSIELGAGSTDTQKLKLVPGKTTMSRSFGSTYKMGSLVGYRFRFYYRFSG